MGRSPCCSKEGLNRGAWSAQEDQILSDYIKSHGEGKWRKIPKEAGLKRCGKSCRLRWLNYLRPDIKRGNITQEEEDLIIRLHNLLGNRWSLIAGRIPGRTDNEIKNYWNTTLGKKVVMNGTSTTTTNQPTNKSVSTVHEKKKKKKNKTKLLSTIVEPTNVAVRTKAFRCSKVVVTPPVTAALPLQIAENRYIDKETTSSEDHAMSDFDIGEFLLSGINNSPGDDASEIWKVWPSDNAPLLFSEEMLKDWMKDDCFHQQS